MSTGQWLVAAALAAAAGTVALAFYLRRHRSKPGADWFLASLGCQALWCGLHALAFLAPTDGVRSALSVLSISALSAVAVCFLLFALEYTGRAEVRGRRAVAALVLPVSIGGGLATNGFHGLFHTGYAVSTVGGVTTINYVFTPLALATGTAVVLLPLVGSTLLFDTVLSYGSLYRREAVAVGLSTLPPVAGFIAWLYGVGPAVNLAVPLILPHVALDAYAFVRGDMFEFHPATQRAGERAAIDDLGSPVVVVDEHGRIVSANPAAERTFGVDASDLLTRPVEDLPGVGPIDLEDGSQRVSVDNGRPRTFSVTVTPLSAASDRPVGYTLTWQDVTESIRREQRLSVLNRVLRHNLRNEVGLVSGLAATARRTAERDDVAEMLDTVERTADDLVSTGETAREIEATLADDLDPPRSRSTTSWKTSSLTHAAIRRRRSNSTASRSRFVPTDRRSGRSWPNCSTTPSATAGRTRPSPSPSRPTRTASRSASPTTARVCRRPNSPSSRRARRRPWNTAPDSGCGWFGGVATGSAQTCLST